MGGWLNLSGVTGFAGLVHVHLQVGDALSPELLRECEELGILVDRDDQGVLLQIFTKPLGGR